MKNRLMRRHADAPPSRLEQPADAAQPRPGETGTRTACGLPHGADDLAAEVCAYPGHPLRLLAHETPSPVQTDTGHPTIDVRGGLMPKFRVKGTVEFEYLIEAEDEDKAKWKAEYKVRCRLIEEDNGCVDVSSHYDWEAEEIRTCRVCGCTDNDCTQCAERTGHPCHWVAKDLCSACIGKEVSP